MKKQTFALSLAFALINFWVNPANAVPSICTDLVVKVTNSTYEDCYLVNLNLIHGYLTTIPASVIPAKYYNDFVMTESVFFGPELSLDYVCGGKRITLFSKQSLSFCGAGSCSGKAISNSPEINAIYTGIDGSCIADRPGIINWTIVPAM